MAVNRNIVVAPLVSIILVDGDNVSTPLGLAENFSFEKRLLIDMPREIGNFAPADIIMMGYEGSFNFSKTYARGIDMVAQGIIPSDDFIAQFMPFTAKIIDLRAQKLLAVLYRAMANLSAISINAQQRMMSNLSGNCVSILFETEL